MRSTSRVLIMVTASICIVPANGYAQDAAQKELQRLQKENEALRKQLEESQKQLILSKLQLEAAKIEAAKGKAIANEMRARMELLTRQLIRLQQLGKKGAPMAPVAKNGAQAAITVVGKITKVDDQDKSLVQLNIGSDKGLKLGEIYDVIRLKPRPIFLGQIRIVEVTNQRALGRQIIRPGSRIRPLQVGDQFTSGRLLKK